MYGTIARSRWPTAAARRAARFMGRSACARHGRGPLRPGPGGSRRAPREPRRRRSPGGGGGSRDSASARISSLISAARASRTRASSVETPCAGAEWPPSTCQAGASFATVARHFHATAAPLPGRLLARRLGRAARRQGCVCARGPVVRDVRRLVTSTPRVTPRRPRRGMRRCSPTGRRARRCRRPGEHEARPPQRPDPGPHLLPDLLGIGKGERGRRPTVPQSASRVPKRRRMRVASMCSGWSGLTAATPISTRSSRIGSKCPSLW